MFRIFTKKKIEIPSGEKQTIEAFETWVVKWYSSTQLFKSGNHADLSPHFEVFCSKEDAEVFADRIKDAFSLTKTKMYYSIEVYKNIETK